MIVNVLTTQPPYSSLWPYFIIIKIKLCTKASSMLFTDILLTSTKKVWGVWFFFVALHLDNWDQIPYLKQVIWCILLYTVHKPIVKSDFWIFYIKQKLKNFRLTCMYIRVDGEVKSILPLQLVTWSIKCLVGH